MLPASSFGIDHRDSAS